MHFPQIQLLTVLLASGLLGTHASQTSGCQKVNYQTFLANQDSAVGKPIQGFNGLYANTAAGCIYTDANQASLAKQHSNFLKSSDVTRRAMLGGQVSRNTATSPFTKAGAKGEAKCKQLCKVASSGPPNGASCEEPCTCQYSYESCQNWHCKSIYTCKPRK